MIRYLFLAVTILWIIFPADSPGQFYVTGENPASIKWKKIQTQHFNIVFPSDLEFDAGLLAKRLESGFEESMGDLERPLRKRFPVLMQNASVLSNGYVALAPRRMELTISPPQDSYAQDWLSQLSLHEFRHIAQLNRLNQGFTRILGWFSGEIARGVVSAQVPTWFFEGDAVYNETRLSGAGRGRSPAFRMPLRTLLLERERIYSYDKAMFGSFRDFVPDHYQYGYELTGFMRTMHGNDVWAKGLNYVSRNPYQIWPMSFYLKKNYGFFKSGLYDRTMDSLKDHYNNIISVLSYSKYKSIVANRESAYTSYLYARDPGYGFTLAFKTGMHDPGSFVTIDSSGKEERILMTGRTQGKFDISDGRLIWDEIVQDPRWQKRDFSVIKELDLASGKKRSVTHRTRYFSPDYSPDGSRIVVAETDIQNRNYLTILNAFNGSVVQQIHTADRAVINPEWAGKVEIIMITVSSRGKQLESVNLSTGMWTVLIAFTMNDINDPVSYGNFILFRGISENTENIFAIERKTPGKIFRLTNSVYGTRYPSVSKDKRHLLFSVYTANGFDVSKIALDTALWEPVISLQTGKEFTSELPDTNSYRWDAAKAYNKAEHLFRIHSWLPFHTDIDAIQDNPVETGLYPGFMIFSQNLLGTAISSIGYSYRDGYHKIHPVFTWRGWYPVIQLRGEIGEPQQILSLPEGRSVPHDASPFVRLSIKTYVPLVFSRGAFSLFIRPEMEYEFSSTWFNYNEDLKRGLGLLHLRFTASNYRRMSVRDLYPVWGQSVAATYSGTLSDNDPFGYLYSAQVSLFFPGMARHHHFYLIAGHQLQEPKRYFLPYARVNFPRGYPERISGEFTSLLLNYSFPVVYPDLSLGPVIYLKRIRTNFFYDIGYGSKIIEYRPGPVVTSGWYNSVGSEIMADFHAFRFIFPVAAGIRLGYRRDQTRPFAELLVRINTTL